MNRNVFFLTKACRTPILNCLRGSEKVKSKEITKALEVYFYETDKNLVITIRWFIWIGLSILVFSIITMQLCSLPTNCFHQILIRFINLPLQFGQLSLQNCFENWWNCLPITLIELLYSLFQLWTHRNGSPKCKNKNPNCEKRAKNKSNVELELNHYWV